MKKSKKRVVLGEGYSCNEWKWDFLMDTKTEKCKGRVIHVPVMFEGIKKYRLVLEEV